MKTSYVLIISVLLAHMFVQYMQKGLRRILRGIENVSETNQPIAFHEILSSFFPPFMLSFILSFSSNFEKNLFSLIHIMSKRF